VRSGAGVRSPTVSSHHPFDGPHKPLGAYLANAGAQSTLNAQQAVAQTVVLAARTPRAPANVELHWRIALAPAEPLPVSRLRMRAISLSCG
ncbi:MAG: hypothetical protein OXF98_06295, partial [Rhodospirillaceae bacterium]|nr:hypothetical protein [Rhodospirillaceae bacterium]